MLSKPFPHGRQGVWYAALQAAQQVWGQLSMAQQLLVLDLEVFNGLYEVTEALDWCAAVRGDGDARAEVAQLVRTPATRVAGSGQGTAAETP